MKSTSTRTRSIVVSNVNAEIGRRRVTQKQMAEWLGLSQASASERLTNKTPFTLDELDVLAGHLGLPVQALFQEPAYAAPFQGGRIEEAGRPEGRPAEVAGAGFEPATSGTWAAGLITADQVALMLAEAEAWANVQVVTS